MSNHHEVRFTSSYGAEVRHLTYTQTQTHRPLVLFNGIGGSVDQWEEFPNYLERDVIAIDTRGGVTADKPTMRDYARVAAHTLRDDLAIDKADIMGQSWGGMLAQEYMLAYRKRIGKVVIACSVPSILIDPPHNLKVIKTLAKAERSANYTKAHAGIIYGGDIKQNPALLDTIGVLNKRDKVAYNRQKVAARKAASNFLRLPLLNLEAKPTLIMSADDDPIARFGNALVLRGILWRNSELHRVHNGGHLFILTRPKESAQTVNTFLDK